MRIKTFRGPDTKSVLEIIKTELGPDAVILSTQTLKENGRNVVEVMAATEPGNDPEERDVLGEEPDFSATPAGLFSTRELEPPATPKLQPVQAPPAQPAVSSGFDPGREWSRMKDILLSFMKPQADMTLLSPRQRLAIEYLEREGVGDLVILDLWRRMKTDSDLSILDVMTDMVGAKPFEKRYWPQKIHGLCGPFGVGKTSTLLRLALDVRKRNPDARVCLGNFDVSQANGRLMLKHYAELSGMIYREFQTQADWKGFGRELSKFDKVFLDFPGLAASANMNDFMRETLGAETTDIKMHLVLSPVYTPGQHEVYRRVYSAQSASSLIWSKLDEAAVYGGIVNECYATGLKVSALSFGPGLTGTLVPAEKEALWRLIFKHQLPRTAVQD